MSNIDMKELISLITSTDNIINDISNVNSRITKGASDYATMVDIKVQEYLKGELSNRYPDIQFMGEEGDKETLDFSKPMWILDPIDGTTNLIHHYPHCAVSLALVKDGQPQLGIVYNPFMKQLFYAELGKGAFLDGEPIHVSETADLSECLASTGTAPYYKEDSKKMFGLIYDLFQDIQDIRRTGSAALEICYTALGITELFFETVLQPWDYAAACIILTEAGGQISDLHGKALTFERASSVLASNGRVHEALLPYFKSF